MTSRPDLVTGRRERCLELVWSDNRLCWFQHVDEKCIVPCQASQPRNRFARLLLAHGPLPQHNHDGAFSPLHQAARHGKWIGIPSYIIWNGPFLAAVRCEWTRRAKPVFWRLAPVAAAEVCRSAERIQQTSAQAATVSASILRVVVPFGNLQLSCDDECAVECVSGQHISGERSSILRR